MADTCQKGAGTIPGFPLLKAWESAVHLEGGWSSLAGKQEESRHLEKQKLLSDSRPTITVKRLFMLWPDL